MNSLFLCVLLSLFGFISTQNNETIQAIRNEIQQRINESATEFEPCDDKFMKKPKFGDLIEIERSGYYHWAVFLKNGTVIQLNNPDFDKLTPRNAFNNFTGHVELRDLKELAGNDSCRVNNKVKEAARKNLKVLSNKDMWKRMKQALKNNITVYNLVTFNCEHFAAKMRFGVSFSSQIEVLKKIVHEVKDKMAELLAKMFHTEKDLIEKYSNKTLVDISSVDED